MSEKNIITITFGSYNGDTVSLIADFTDDLMEVLTDNGIKDVSIKIVDISHTPDNQWVLDI